MAAMDLSATVSDDLCAGVDPGPRWRLRFWSIFTGQALSMVGSALTQFVLLWWITDTTGSVTALSIAGLAALLPQALLGPLGGTLADRYSRRFLMMASDLVSAACMMVLIALFLTERVELWHLYTMMLIRSAMTAFQQPAAAASAAMLVPLSFLSRAAGLNQTLFGIITVAAAPLGALAISVMPLGMALGIDVVTAVLAIVPLLVYTIPQSKPPARERTNLWREFSEGVHTVWMNPGLRRVYGLLGAVILVMMPTFTLVPLLVKEHFAGGAEQVAVIESLCGVGMMAGGIAVAIVAPRQKILWVLFGFATSCLAVALTAMAPADMFWLAVAWWAIGSALYIAADASITALLQSTVPNHLQGRVLSLLATVLNLGAPVGLIIATPLGEAIGVRWLFIVLGIFGWLVTMLGFLSPIVRSMDGPAIELPERRSKRALSLP
jgi:DHA3 family macrolide efflux protein-like MFS transporter